MSNVGTGFSVSTSPGATTTRRVENTLILPDGSVIVGPGGQVDTYNGYTWYQYGYGHVVKLNADGTFNFDFKTNTHYSTVNSGFGYGDGFLLTTGNTVMINGYYSPISDVGVQVQGVYRINQNGLPDNGSTFITSDIKYVRNYSELYTDRSLVDKGYVDSLVYSGVTANTVTANNGLTLSGNNVRLGGTLTGNTDITGGGLYNLNLGTSGSRLNQLNINTDNTISIESIGASYSSYIGFGGTDNYVEYEANGGDTYHGLNFNTGGATLYATDSTAGNQNTHIYLEPLSGENRIRIDGNSLFKGIVYNEDYSANYTNRSLVDKEYVDNATSGNSNPTGYILTGTTYTATTESFIGVSGTTGSTVWLPISPVSFKQYTVADIAGNASTNNITINGNTKLIQGVSTSLINSNYGSFTFVYNGFNWSVISIV
jgi:hypothetical protein